MAASVGDPMSQYQLLSGKTVLVIGASLMTTDRRFIWKTFQDLKAKVRFCNSCEPMFMDEFANGFPYITTVWYFFFFFLNSLTFDIF